MRRSKEIFYASDAIGIEDYLHSLCGNVTEIYVSTLKEGEARLPKYNLTQPKSSKRHWITLRYHSQ